MTSYTASQIAAMTTTQINALAAATISAFTSADVQALSTTQLNGLSKASFQALNASYLTASQLAGLAAPEVAYLTTAQLAGFTTTEMTALTTTELNALPSADLSALSKAQEQDLTVSQIAGMSASAFDALNLGNLLISQLTGVTSLEVSSLSTANFDKLAPELSSLNPAALAGVSVADLESLTAAQVNGLTLTQISALTGAASSYVKDFHGVYAELAKVESGASLTFAGAETLLQTEASGGSSAGKFAALTDIAKSLNTSGGPSASSMVAQLFDDVVLGNAANAKWTGGAASSAALGDLSASSSQAQFGELLDKWFLGSDNPTASNVYASTYQTQAGSLFSGTPTFAQVNQGAVGDCYFESAMAAVADFDPSLLENMITSDGNGVFTVDFYNGASDPHDYVTVNDQMPIMSPGYAFASGSHLTFDNGGVSGAIWSEVMEKAFVEFDTQSGMTNAYTAIAGGWDNGLSAITGQSIQDYTPFGDTTSQLGALLATCGAAMKAGDAVMMNDVSANSSLNLVGSHMYNVLSVNAAAGTVTLDNPWNANGFAGGVGESFTDSIASLASAGCTFHVATGAARTA
jgi:hypothetical protein